MTAASPIWRVLGTAAAFVIDGLAVAADEFEGFEGIFCAFAGFDYGLCVEFAEFEIQAGDFGGS